jgi:hypothetical protein
MFLGGNGEPMNEEMLKYHKFSNTTMWAFKHFNKEVIFSIIFVIS